MKTTVTEMMLRKGLTEIDAQKSIKKDMRTAKRALPMRCPTYRPIGDESTQDAIRRYVHETESLNYLTHCDVTFCAPCDLGDDEPDDL